MLSISKSTFLKRRKTIPQEAKDAQAKFKKAMRAAINEEVLEYRYTQVIDAAIAGDIQQADLYRFGAGWDVSHREPLSSLIHMFLRENGLFWEDMTLRVGSYYLREPGLSRWRNWHRSYSERNDNLFLQPKAQNRREPRYFFDLPSRDHGSF